MLRPLSWKIFGPNIEVIARNKAGKREIIYLKPGNTNVLLFNETLDDNDLIELAGELDYSYARISNYNNDVAIIRDAINTNSLHSTPWHESRSNPMGPLSSLFESRNISPYKWMKDLTSLETLYPHTEKILFLNIIQEYQRIITIEIITDKLYIFNREEKESLISFFDVMESFQPDRIVHFDGYSIQIPLLIERANHHGLSLPTIVKTHQTPLGSETKVSYDFEMEEWDLLAYFRLKMPYLPNHKLEMISKTLYVEKDSDIERLHSLYYMVRSDIERICNLIHITGETLLRSSPSQIIDHLGYQIDPGTIYKRGYKNKKNGDFFIFPEVGIYRNCYVYDYSKILLESMSKQDSSITKESIKRLGNQGMSLTLALWNCRFTQTDDKDVREFFDKYEKYIIEINDKVIVSAVPLPLDMIEKYNLYAVYGKTGRYIVSNDTLHCIGTGGPFCPKNKLESNLIEDWINHLLYKTKYRPGTNFTAENVVMKTKIKGHNYYVPGTLSFSLAFQYEKKGEIEDWVEVEYLIINGKPILYTKGKKVDTQYYQKRLKELHTRLLKI